MQNLPPSSAPTKGAPPRPPEPARVEEHSPSGPSATADHFERSDPSLDVGRANVVETRGNQTRFRGLHAYKTALGPEFSAALDALARRPGARWLDAGAGGGGAAQQFLESAPGCLVTLVDHQSSVEASGTLSVMTGRFLEDIPDRDLPRCDLITDVIGPFAYSSRPDLVLSKYLRALNDDGRLFLALGSGMDLHLFGKSSRVIVEDGRALTYAEWLQEIPGIQVELRSRQVLNELETPFEVVSAEVRKLPGQAIVIPPLEVVWFGEGGPPKLLLKVAGAAIPGAAVERFEASSREAHARAFHPEDVGALVDGFCAGSLGHPLLEARARVPDGATWAHFGPTSDGARASIARGVLELGPASAGQAFGLVALRAHRAITSASLGLAGTSLEDLRGRRDLAMIADRGGPFSWSLHPDRVLRDYLGALTDDGELVLHLGKERDGISGATKILTRDGETLRLRDWLRKLEGVSVSFTERDAPWPDREVISRIRLRDRAKLRVPMLDLLGVQPASPEGTFAPILRESETEPMPSGFKVTALKWAKFVWKNYLK